MARFLALDLLKIKRPVHGAVRFFTLLGAVALLTASLRGQTMMQPASGAPASTNAAPVAPKGPAPAAANAVKPPAPAANVAKPPAPVATAAKPPAPPQILPPPIPDTFNRYGKIWAPSDDVAHPIKLNVQFPGVGEMKIPSQDELNVRDKLEQLATLSDDDIRAQLALWPPYAKMKLADEGQLLIRIQQFKEQRTHIAMDQARELGLVNSLTPEQKAKFEKEYWDKRLQMDHELAKQFDPIMKARQQKLKEDLFREFSTVGTAVPPPPGPKPPAPPAMPLAQTKPLDPTNTTTPPPPIMPIAQGKPAPGTTPPVAH